MKAMGWFRRSIEAVCDWYCRVFGSPTAFAVSIIGLIVWMAPIPAMGWARWNSSIGLLGNNIESTGEWFFGVATLVIATTLNKRQRADQDASQEREQRQQAQAQAQSDRIEALERAIREDQAREIQLLQQALGVTSERREQLLAGQSGDAA